MQRAAAFASHRAAKIVSSEIARLAALACGDAAAAAYLHPIAKATQVGHILRSAACAARVIEVKSSDAMVGAGFRRIAARAIAPVPDVLRRYPAALPGNSRLSQLVCELDSAIRYGTGEA
ncbi:hypothetical protein [Rhodococcus sp. BP-332]|uniref:hypothetical protein n=1 Tax=Rhodococcus sp. BP-332 TaxID=2739447 RepID=UPI0027E17B1E|nr:hypothetical protein [Rhodococcus sp. BP-332]